MNTVTTNSIERIGDFPLGSPREYYEEENDFLDEEAFLPIQEEYRRKRLIETLIGPIVSTAFHVILIIVLAIMITEKVKEPVAEIEVTIEQIEDVELEEPPPIEEPDPIEEPQETTNPVLTTVAVENVDTNDQALEDTNDDTPSTDDNMNEQVVSDIVVSPSAFASPSVYGGRSAAGRASSVSQFGGSKAGQDSLMKALWWLAKVQNPDGSWGSQSQGGLTGLALLTFLAHGETPTSKHFGTNVKKAIKWLINDPVRKGKKHQAYDHAIKTYALAEAYAMTGVSSIEPKMNECMKLIIDNQQKGGAFDYGYNKNEGQQDLSLSGWNYQAMKAAYGSGCEVVGLQDAIYKSVAWLKKMGGSRLSYVYTYANNDSSKAKGEPRKPSMRAVGSLCLQLFGEGNCREIQDDIKLIATEDIKQLNWAKAPDFSLYGWYYATQVMFQHGGTYWQVWNRQFQKLLITNQNKEGYWDYPNIHPGVARHLGGTMGNRIYATTLCGLMLTVYYRYLPSSKGAKGGRPTNKAKKIEALIEEEGLDLLD